MDIIDWQGLAKAEKRDNERLKKERDAALGRVSELEARLGMGRAPAERRCELSGANGRRALWTYG